MSTDDPNDEAVPDEDAIDADTGEAAERRQIASLDGWSDSETFDDQVLELLAWVLDTETRARIYVSLRRDPWSTSREVAEATGLYPSTVREALAALHEDDLVDRRKRASERAGNNPYEYTGMAPGDLVSRAIGDIQAQLNAVCNLDDYLEGGEPTTAPVRITIRGLPTESGGTESDG